MPKHCYIIFNIRQCIAVYTCEYSFVNFLRCISQSRRTKQTRKISCLEKLEMES